MPQSVKPFEPHLQTLHVGQVRCQRLRRLLAEHESPPLADAVRDIGIRANADTLAAVIVEPVQPSRGWYLISVFDRVHQQKKMSQY